MTQERTVVAQWEAMVEIAAAMYLAGVIEVTLGLIGQSSSAENTMELVERVGMQAATEVDPVAFRASMGDMLEALLERHTAIAHGHEQKTASWQA